MYIHIYIQIFTSQSPLVLSNFQDSKDISCKKSMIWPPIKYKKPKMVSTTSNRDPGNLP